MYQDHSGFLWIGTRNGLNRYDGQRFVTFRHQYGQAGSLQSSEVTALAEDRAHRLWVGTMNGGMHQLNPDGHSFTHIARTSSGTDIGHWAISCIVPDGRGRLWAGTLGSGWLIVDPERKRADQFRLPDSLGISPHVTCAFADRDATLWFGLDDGSLVQIGPDGTYRGKLMLPAGSGKGQPRRINAVLRTQSGLLLVASRNQGVYRLEEAGGKRKGSGQLIRVYGQYDSEKKENIITCLAQDKGGWLWIGTDDGIRRTRVESLPEILPESLSAKASAKDQFQAEVLRHNPADEFSLSTHAVLSLLADRHGNVWVGTWEGGMNVHYSQAPRFEWITHRSSGQRRLRTPRVTAVATDPQGNLWLGSVEGLQRFGAQASGSHAIGNPLTGNPLTGNRPRPDKAPAQPVSLSGVIPGEDVYRMCTDRTGHLYVSFWRGGVALYSTPEKARLLTVVNRPGQHMVAFAPARQGGVWMLRSDGELFFHDPVSDRTRVFGNVGRLSTGSSVTCLLEDRQGWLWMGTYEKGLLGWDYRSGRIRRYQPGPGGLSDNHVSCLYEDAAGTLWIGTHSAGLNRKAAGSEKITVFTKKDGLAGDMIASIEEDARHNLWISTAEGLTRLEQARQRCTAYTESDGLPPGEFVSQGSTLLPDGSLAFASTDGLVMVHPERFDKPQAPPQAYLEQLLLFNRPVTASSHGVNSHEVSSHGVRSNAAGSEAALLHTELRLADKLTLTARQNVFTLNFAALCWNRNPHIAYAYRLEGFDRQWRHTDQRHADQPSGTTYTNLPPGSYVFRLKAALPNQPWGGESVLRIVIEPPWYATHWAMAGYILFGLGLLAGVRHLIRVREQLRADARIQRMRVSSIQELEKAKTSFFTNISHEFKTPLTLILTPLERLLSEQLPPADQMRYQFQIMQRNAGRLLRLINQLLDLSRLENGTLKPRIRPVQLTAYLQSLLDSFDPLARAKAIMLKTAFDPSLVQVWTDPDFLEKIVTNLLSNALKYTPDGGLVSLSVSQVSGKGQGWLQLLVQDTGEGIAPEEQATVFQRFYRSSRSQVPGTGIGLSLTRELTELLGGSVHLESTLGVGSCFRILLPTRAEDFPAEWLSEPLPIPVPLEGMPAELTQLPPEEDRTLLLIAEDDPDLNRYLCSFFARHFQVLSAGNGRQALELTREHLPDLVISDWMMPELEGSELCKLLKNEEATSHIPLILLTSKASQASQLEGLGIGADDYVTKPFSAALLLGRVNNLLQNRRLLREAFGREVWLRPADVQLSNLDELFLKRATALIEEHIDDVHFDAEQLQEAMNMSQMQLYRKLKSLTNLSARDFIRYIRLERAAQLLKTGQVNVSEAGYRVGFNDRSYFSRAFKKQFGHSPAQHAAHQG